MTLEEGCVEDAGRRRGTKPATRVQQQRSAGGMCRRGEIEIEIQMFKTQRATERCLLTLADFQNVLVGKTFRCGGGVVCTGQMTLLAQQYVLQVKTFCVSSFCLRLSAPLSQAQTLKRLKP
jgi:hypothetical protein